MRIMTVAFAVGTALVMCNLGTFAAAACLPAESQSGS
jgi:hypothetical protein